MLKEPKNNPNERIFSEATSIAKENRNCKDGFCTLPNQKEFSKKDANDINLFDPI